MGKFEFLLEIDEEIKAYEKSIQSLKDSSAYLHKTISSNNRKIENLIQEIEFRKKVSDVVEKNIQGE